MCALISYDSHVTGRSATAAGRICICLSRPALCQAASRMQRDRDCRSESDAEPATGSGLGQGLGPTTLELHCGRAGACPLATWSGGPSAVLGHSPSPATFSPTAYPPASVLDRPRQASALGELQPCFPSGAGRLWSVIMRRWLAGASLDLRLPDSPSGPASRVIREHTFALLRAPVCFLSSPSDPD